MYPDTPPCPKCDQPTEQIHLPSFMRNAPPAVVVFRAPDGSFRFPGDADGIQAGRYAAEGLERIELRGWREIRRFEQTVNERENADIRRRVERQLEAQSRGESIRRADFHAGMNHGFLVPEMAEDAQGQIRPTGRMKTVVLSDRAKEIARHTMAINNNKRVRSYDSGFHVEVYSMDRSNREESRDAQGRRRRD